MTAEPDTTTRAAARGAIGRWRALPDGWRLAITAAAALRAAIAVLSVAGAGLLPGLEPVSVVALPELGFGGWPARTAADQGVGLVGGSLERFDALWYLAIARDGYPAAHPDGGIPGAVAFFPGYPLLVGLLGRLLAGSYLLAASLISFAAAVVAFAGIHRLVELETRDPDLARRAVVLLALFPTSFFLFAPYSEAVFLAASAWGLVLLRERRWLLAAWPIAGAALTRNVGLLLVVPVLLEAWRQRREGSGPRPWTVAVPLGAAALGLLTMASLGAARYGSVLAAFDVQSGWQRELTWPWVSLLDAVRFGIGDLGRYATGYHSLDVLVFVPVLAAVLWLVRRAPATYGYHALAHVLVWLVYPFAQRPLMSTPRFALAVAPLTWAFAAWTRGRASESAWAAASGALLGLHLLLFVGWYYVF